MDIEEYSKYTHFYTEDVPQLLLEFLDRVNWKSYLDLGCGDGTLLYALNKKGYFNNKIVYAVDLSENRINLVKNINRDFICFVGSACDIKNIKDASIDFLVSTQVIEHVPNDEDMVREIKRVLKRNGLLYLSTVFKKWYGWHFYRYNGRWVLDPTHLREYVQDDQLLNIFEKYDFEIIESKKSLQRFSIIDFIFIRMGVHRNIFNNRFWKLLRNLKVPILGYYNWEIVCRQK